MRFSHIELLLMYEHWAGEQLVVEKAFTRYRREGRQVYVSAVPLSPGIENWRPCRHLGAFIVACFT